MLAHELLVGCAMRSRWILFPWAAAIAGLAGCHSQKIDDLANGKLSDERTYAERNARYPTCPDRGAIAGNCGLLLKHASTEDFRVKFRDLKCVGKDDAGCEALYRRMLDAWLIKRYPLADWRAVGLACDGDPGRCDDPVKYELLLVDSHNVRVRDDFARAENEIEAQRDEEQNRHVAAQINGTAAVLGEVAYAAHRGPKCRSYPSLFGIATNTVCTQ